MFEKEPDADNSSPQEPQWKKLRAFVADPDLMAAFAEHRRAEREREDAGA